jgi:hypothetical protein
MGGRAGHPLRFGERGGWRHPRCQPSNINVNSFHCMQHRLPPFAKDAKDGAPFVFRCRAVKVNNREGLSTGPHSRFLTGSSARFGMTSISRWIFLGEQLVCKLVGSCDNENHENCRGL